MGVAPTRYAVVDLVPFILVADVERSIPFYEALGFEVIKRYEHNGRLEFAGLEATSSAKVMLARDDDVPETGPDARTPGPPDVHPRPRRPRPHGGRAVRGVGRARPGAMKILGL